MASKEESVKLADLNLKIAIAFALLFIASLLLYIAFLK
ncbi:MAG: hypothetical protein UY21_C0009G0042 [Microgenomates group bacterium GW2011_GWA1_48_10]|nr:MAG: hypothetical protein UY21_C0009G0042 [Microgenomates group bacterium GW2011_GWA1_48_10]